MRTRQFRPSLGLLESRISLSDILSATGATMYQNSYEFSATDGPSPGDYDPCGSGGFPIVPDTTTATDGFNGILLESVID